MNQSELIPTAQSSKTHRLEGKVFWRWWQMSMFFSSPFRRKNAEPDKYENSALKAQLLFLTQLPFGIGIMLHVAGPEGLKLALLGAAVGVLMFVQFVYTFKHHCKYIIEVQEQESGIVLKSPMVNRTVRWLEIVDFFVIQNGDYILQCSDGENFVLSNDLTDGAKLFERISALKPKTTEQYTYSYRLPIGFIDGPAIASLAVIVATIFPILNWFLYADKFSEPPVTQALIAAVVIPIAVAHWRICFARVAELVRFGKHSIRIRTRTGKVSDIQLDEIRSVKRLVGLFLVKSRQGWFLALADGNEPASDKLLDTKKQVQLIR